jgi:hypothetical protein
METEDLADVEKYVGMKAEPLRAAYGNVERSLAISRPACILQTNRGLSGLSAIQPKSKFRLTRRGGF